MLSSTAIRICVMNRMGSYFRIHSRLTESHGFKSPGLEGDLIRGKQTYLKIRRCLIRSPGNDNSSIRFLYMR